MTNLLIYIFSPYMSFFVNACLFICQAEDHLHSNCFHNPSQSNYRTCQVGPSVRGKNINTVFVVTNMTAIKQTDRTSQADYADEMLRCVYVHQKQIQQNKLLCYTNTVTKFILHKSILIILEIWPLLHLKNCLWQRRKHPSV